MINWKVDVIDAGLSSSTDEEILTALLADSRTRQDLDAWFVEDLLNLGGYGLLYRNGRDWDGPLKQLADNENTPEQVKKAILWLCGHLDSPDRKKVLTSQTRISTLIFAVLGLVGSVGVTDEIRDEIILKTYAAGNGRKFEGLTLEEVAEIRVRYEKGALAKQVDDLFELARQAANEAVWNGSDLETAVAAGLTVIQGEEG